VNDLKMHRHYSALGKCFIAALIAGIFAQLSSTASFMRWSAAQGNNYSSEFWDIAISTWHQDGLTMFLIWGVVSLVTYLLLTRLMAHRETAEKTITWLIIPITLIFSLLMYQGFKIYL